jgi:hypothetical protein
MKFKRRHGEFERKLHSDWRSPTDTPTLSPTVVAGLRVRYSRHRSSPETFFVREICSWWEAFVNRGSTVFMKIKAAVNYDTVMVWNLIASFINIPSKLCRQTHTPRVSLYTRSFWVRNKIMLTLFEWRNWNCNCGTANWHYAHAIYQVSFV